MPNNTAAHHGISDVAIDAGEAVFFIACSDLAATGLCAYLLAIPAKTRLAGSKTIGSAECRRLHRQAYENDSRLLRNQLVLVGKKYILPRRAAVLLCTQV